MHDAALVARPGVVADGRDADSLAQVGEAALELGDDPREAGLAQGDEGLARPALGVVVPLQQAEGLVQGRLQAAELAATAGALGQGSLGGVVALGEEVAARAEGRALEGHQELILPAAQALDQGHPVPLVNLESLLNRGSSHRRHTYVPSILLSSSVPQKAGSVPWSSRIRRSSSVSPLAREAISLSLRRSIG